jgi:DNA-binding NarL/FixJ family response regulator
MTATRVLLADDHWLVRAGFKSMLANFGDFEVVGEASSGHEALDLVAKCQPQLVLMDISMPRLNGVEATRRIISEYPAVRVLMLSMHVDEQHVLKALRAGAVGYVFKGSPPSELHLAIEAVARGDIFLSPAISRHVLDNFLRQTATETNSLEQLTSRQREILQLIAEGNTSKGIARLLGSSVKTIESHRANLMDKLGIHNIPGLVRYAIRYGLVSPEK